jgi:hypothetical protein
MKPGAMSENRRKQIPAMVKLEVALQKMGLSIKRVRFDHHPPLELRPMNADGTDTNPPANDPAYIQILTIEDHATKTFGTRATTAGSDIQKIAASKRLRSDQEEFRRRMLSKAGQGDPEHEPPRKRSQWPKRKVRG